MQLLDLEQTAAYLELARIDQTIDLGHAILHSGINAAGINFLLINNMEGETVLTEGL